MTIIENKKILILAFNLGYAGRVINGPGISLHNFCSILQKNNVNFNVSTVLSTRKEFLKPYVLNKQILNIKNKNEYSHIHIWSNIGNYFDSVLKRFNYEKIIIGPNFIDFVDIEKEKFLIKSLPDSKKEFFVVNNNFKKKLYEKYNISSKILSIGPDFNDWSFEENKKPFILWKGNSSHKVKNIEQALEIKKIMKKYNFVIMGHPHPYSYKNHIDIAKKAKLYFTTSFSETKGNTVSEQMACGTPCITNHNIFFKGIHEKTGIITDGSTKSYCEAIDYLMNAKNYNFIQKESSKYCKEYFDHKKILNTYLEAL